jgi:hypothetical protein
MYNAKQCALPSSLINLQAIYPTFSGAQMLSLSYNAQKVWKQNAVQLFYEGIPDMPNIKRVLSSHLYVILFEP